MEASFLGLVMALCIPGTFKVAAAVIQSEVSSKDYPYMVSIELPNYHQCAGVILNKDYILTTAVCVNGDAANEISVRFGSKKPLGSGVTSKVSQIKEHRNYKWPELHDDIAILKLASPVSTQIHPVTLPKQGEQIKEHSEGTIVGGWGHYHKDETILSRSLQKYNVNILNKGICRKVMGSRNITVPETSICAGGGESFCKRDPSRPPLHKGQMFGSFGDALILNDTLVGLMSLLPCVFPHTPGMFTGVANFANWIKSNSGESHELTATPGPPGSQLRAKQPLSVTGTPNSLGTQEGMKESSGKLEPIVIRNPMATTGERRARTTASDKRITIDARVTTSKNNIFQTHQGNKTDNQDKPVA